MADSFIPIQSGEISGDSATAGAIGFYPSLAEGGGRHTLAWSVLTAQKNPPLFCNPIALFIAIWILMLACLGVHVSYVTYPYLGTPLLLFALSALSLVLGYVASGALFERRVEPVEAKADVLDVTTLWHINVLLCVCALSIVVMNWVTAGPPPALGYASTYLVYGKLKQILFPVLTAVAVNSMLDPSRFRRFLLLTFSLTLLALYITRGVLLLTFLQIFFLYSLRTRMSNRKQYLFAVGAFVLAIAGATIFGNLRTAHVIFVTFLQIREKYADWPMAWLWFVSYVSTPMSNLCWLVLRPADHGPTIAFLYPLLPSFVAPTNPYVDTFLSRHIIDNASTYLQTYVLDFSYLGIYFANLLLGVGCRWFDTRLQPRHVLLMPIFLASMTLIFFTDNFLLLSTIIQVFIQSHVEKRCFLTTS